MAKVERFVLAPRRQRWLVHVGGVFVRCGPIFKWNRQKSDVVATDKLLLGVIPRALDPFLRLPWGSEAP